MSKALATKNVAAALLGFAMIASTFAFATPANAQSASDLQAQINALLAQIAAMQGNSSNASCTATFTLNLKLGSRGSEVMALQKFLNSSADTRVAASGAGSPGNETSYFGAATRAAVIKFQQKYAADILTPVGLSRGTGNWFASTRAKANALCAASPSNPGNPTTPTTGGSLMVAAASQPANSLAVASAARVPFTRFTLTNTSNAAVTVNSVVVERTGLSANANFAGVILIDESTGQQLGIARILGSDNRATIGEAVTLQPGQSRTFTVAGNMAAASAVNGGEVASFAVVAVNATGTVSGSLPITGAMHTMNDTLTLGTATVDRGTQYPGTSGIDQNIGTTDYAFNSVRITAGSAEDIRVTSVRFNQSGSASASDLANVRVVVDGVTYPTTVSADGKYYTANFGSGIVITKGLSKEVVVRGDIVGGAGRTVSFDVYRLTDIGVVGQTYGYGITPTASGQFSSTATPTYNANDVDIVGGTVQSIARSNVTPTGNVAELVPNTALGSFTLAFQGEAVQVQTVKIAINITNGSADADDITNITLVDQNGAVLAGPVDGSATDFSGVDGSVTFSGVIFPAGTTVVTIKGQLGSDFAAADTIVLEVDLTEWSGATGMTTGNSVTLTGSATGNTQTVQAATLAATTLLQPAARSVVKGTVDHVFATAALSANSSGEDIRVTAVQISDVTSAASIPADIDNVEIWANLSGGTTNDSVRGDVFETKVSNTTQFVETTADADEDLTITFTSPIVIARNTTVEIAVVGDVSASATGLGTHTLKLDTDAGDVTAVSVNTGSSVSVTPSGSGQAMTLAANGTLTVTVDGASPLAQVMLDNTLTEQTIAIFDMAASNVEAIEIDSMVLDQDGTTNNQVIASYRIYKGSTLLTTVVNTGAATLTATIPDGALVIPANQSVDVTVKAVMNNIDGTTVVNGNTASVSLDTTTGTGQGSSATVTDSDAVQPAAHEVYEAYPTFAFDNTGLSTVLTPSTNYLVAKIVVSNPGDKDVKFLTGDDNNLTLQVNSSSDDTDTALETLTIRNNAGTTLDSTAVWQATTSSEVNFDFSSADFVVPAGGTDTIWVYADTTDHEDDGDTLSVWLDDTDADVDFAIGDVDANYEVGAIVNRGDKFGPTHVNP